MRDEKEATKRNPKAPTRYWKVMRGNLYARLQYRDGTGRWREKLRPIAEKKAARSVVEQMRRELETHGEEALTHEQITFAEFAPIYKAAKLTPPVYANGVKVSGIKSRLNWAYDSLVAYFAKTPIRAIKPRHLEVYKLDRLKTTTRHGTPRSITTVNRELALLRAMLNYAVQNDLLIQNPFTKARGIIVVSAEKERTGSSRIAKRSDCWKPALTSVLIFVRS